MIQASNQINLYRKASKEMCEDAGFGFQPPKFLYYEDNEKRIIDEIDQDDERILINKYDSNWTPEEHNLILKQKFYIENPDLLFGEKGIVANDNSIGIGVHISSQKSFFQETRNFGTISSSKKKLEFEFQIDFPVKSLRGEINFEYFIYLKEKKSLISGQAKTIGLKLCEENIYEFSLAVDGDGSTFPILDFSEKEGPLWKIEKNWVDASDDIFDASSVYIALNTKHDLFKRVKANNTRGSKALMGEIILQSLTMIINEVINVENHDLTSTDIIPGTILMAVKYWVETFEVQTESIYSISNSLRKNQGDLLYGG